jgi:hypothetical protein
MILGPTWINISKRPNRRKWCVVTSSNCVYFYLAAGHVKRLQQANHKTPATSDANGERLNDDQRPAFDGPKCVNGTNSKVGASGTWRRGKYATHKCATIIRWRLVWGRTSNTSVPSCGMHSSIVLLVEREARWPPAAAASPGIQEPMASDSAQKAKGEQQTAERGECGTKRRRRMKSNEEGERGLVFCFCS